MIIEAILDKLLGLPNNSDIYRNKVKKQPI